MRRMKTWLRSTMSDERLSGLCIRSFHRKKVNSHKNKLINRVIDKFGRDPRTSRI
ncbi:hypothetical protein HOLleu_15456 [Holothuria leucospilota]|uniref:Uncharacterized protein n=1 Tax=Holothuria leucospilota TaxID=206669 RepID=A0A9Q1C802_HOLLE|nr:hypothetical protein HOLleu_15456 [Holothuria leucospilota]